MDNKNKIAVIGAGNGGTAIAGFLARCGADVAICDLFPQYVEGIQKNGGIELTLNGKTTHETLRLITTDVKEAIEGASLIMVVTPAFTHRMIAEAVYSALRDGQIIVLNPGRTGGALEFLNTLRKNGCSADVTVAETQTLIYSCRKVSDAGVEIYGVKKEVDLGAFPSDRTDAVLQALAPYYPQFRGADSCLMTSLSNIGALFHPAPVLLNIGRIENDERGFRYYIDGITPAVAGLIETLDRERMAVAKAYETRVLSAQEWLLQSYDTHGDDLYTLLQNNDAYAEIRAPKTIDARYVTEDVPMSLVPISELGRAAQVKTPAIDAVITLAGAVYKKDFRAEGRNMERLGIDGMTKEQIIRYLKTGKKE